MTLTQWISIAGFAITLLTVAISLGRLVQSFRSHETLDNERHENLKDDLKEIKGDLKTILRSNLMKGYRQ